MIVLYKFLGKYLSFEILEKLPLHMAEAVGQSHAACAALLIIMVKICNNKVFKSTLTILFIVKWQL
jgi:hypothetical protein